VAIQDRIINKQEYARTQRILQHVFRGNTSRLTSCHHRSNPVSSRPSRHSRARQRCSRESRHPRWRHAPRETSALASERRRGAPSTDGARTAPRGTASDRRHGRPGGPPRRALAPIVAPHPPRHPTKPAQRTPGAGGPARSAVSCGRGATRRGKSRAGKLTESALSEVKRAPLDISAGVVGEIIGCAFGSEALCSPDRWRDCPWASGGTPLTAWWPRAALGVW
jgi:hypothetical protein